MFAASCVGVRGAARVDVTVREPWRKPTFYDLTDYIDTAGSPTNKSHKNMAPLAEDETRPHAPTRRKRYRPFTA